ncbi:hypothetical protein HMPREF9372_0171 [Sporosarcina newyorkensis 2681]|uniref:Uncharacterized protein n=1 Tax=Sporosarcina newyorkensis 2681 TaxID=1027292 RepID=F9DMZ1_9BACL|nr:hypothetical protein HMPREF9372_0171 [Sporosarcina newyorkensis 2681]
MQRAFGKDLLTVFLRYLVALAQDMEIWNMQYNYADKRFFSRSVITENTNSYMLYKLNGKLSQ